MAPQCLKGAVLQTYGPPVIFFLHPLEGLYILPRGINSKMNPVIDNQEESKCSRDRGSYPADQPMLENRDTQRYSSKQSHFEAQAVSQSKNHRLNFLWKLSNFLTESFQQPKRKKRIRIERKCEFKKSREMFLLKQKRPFSLNTQEEINNSNSQTAVKICLQ